MNQLWTLTKVGSLIGLILFLLIDTSGGTVEAFQQVENDTTINSESVCSPGTHDVCMPGPFSETIQVPNNAFQIRVDVYWDWEGHPGSIQPNEHSYFTLNSEGERLGRVYCEDMGDGLVEPQYCGTVEAGVEPGQRLRLTIVHADTEEGPTPGSHSQDWVISWLTRPATPTAPAVTNTPVATQTATPQVEPTEETAVPTETATTEAPTQTPTASATPGEVTPTATPGGETSTPAVTETGTPAASPTTVGEPTQTATGQVLPTETTITPTPSPTAGEEPTQTATGQVEPTETTITPTQPPAATETETAPRPPSQATRTPAPAQATGTPSAPGEGAVQAQTTSTPDQIVPQTGADLTVNVSNLYPGLLVKGGVVFLGAALILLGFWRKNKNQ